jgi:STE24 endopeptidase
MFALLIAVYLVVLGMRFALYFLNRSHLKKYGRVVPHELEGMIDPAELGGISDYTLETGRADMVETTVVSLAMAAFLFGGLLGRYDAWIASLHGSFIGRGLLFSLGLMYAETLFGIPFSLHRNFRIENRFGFNTMTLRLWLTDLAKSFAISTLLGIAAASAVLAIIQASPDRWWLWAWAFLLAFGVFVMYLSPTVIEPLFFKFEPVAAEGLEERIRALMERAGLKVGRVFQVDASRRSRHSNAYFTGIGRVKRIVLFDTLVRQLSADELLAVLAHEAGHWKKKHLLKGLVIAETLALFGLFAAHKLVSWNGLPELVDLSGASFYARAVIAWFIGGLAAFFLTPLFSYLSRRNERAADGFAADLTGDPGALASALAKLSRDNLSNLHPHPFYASFYYSHPATAERIGGLRGLNNDVATG